MHRNRIERTESKLWRGSVRQIWAAATYSLSCFNHGCSIAWVSGVLGTEALTGGAWLAALPCLVALPAAPFFAFLADAKGRKAAIFCVSLCFIISSCLSAWGGARGVWAARVVAGVGGAGALSLAPLYCAEIAPRTKGIAVITAFGSSTGILFSYCVGIVSSAHQLSLTVASPSLLLIILLKWLPETPAFLISVGKIQQAAKVMCWLEGSDFREDLTDVVEQQEVRIRTSTVFHERRDVLRRQDSDIFQPMLKRAAESGLESNSESNRIKEPSVLIQLFRERRSLRALLSCMVVLAASAGCGAGAVSSFATAVLRHSTHDVPGLNMTVYNFTMYNGTLPRKFIESSEAGSVVCGLALVFGGMMAVACVERVGRKSLLIWSCTGIVLFLAALAKYCDSEFRQFSWVLQDHWPYFAYTNASTHDSDVTAEMNLTDAGNPWYKLRFGNESVGTMLWATKIGSLLKDDETEWPPIILLSLTMFFYNSGLGSIPYVLMSEMFAVRVRSLASSLLISWMWLTNFLVLRYFGAIAVAFGLQVTYYLGASFTLTGAIFILLCLPETKGKNQQQIDEALEGSLIVVKRRRKDNR